MLEDMKTERDEEREERRRFHDTALRLMERLEESADSMITNRGGEKQGRRSPGALFQEKEKRPRVEDKEDKGF